MVLAIINKELFPTVEFADVSLIPGTEIPIHIERHTLPMSVLNAPISAITLRKKETEISALNWIKSDFEEF